MTQLKDSRVIAAFKANSEQYRYMLGSEQRLTGLESEVLRIAQSSGTDPALVAQVSTNTANIAINASGIATLNSDVSAIETGYVKRNVAQDALVYASISTASTSYVSTPLVATINISTNTDKALALFSFPMSYISASVTAYGTVAISVNGGAEIPISLVYTGAAGFYDLNGVAGSIMLGGLSGSSTIRVRFKTTSGTFYLSDPSFPGYSSLTVIEI